MHPNFQNFKHLVLFMVLFMKSITAHAEISIVRENGKLIVSSGDQLFTQYIYADENRAKPVFYPIIGPNGNEMTRSFPFEKDKEGEEADHPHHTSLWYTHGMVNGVEFWALGDKKGKIVHEEFIEMNTNSFVQSTLWKDADGKTVCQDRRRVSFHLPDTKSRAIDFEITLIASVDDLTLGDTKEGSFGIRMAPAYRLKGNVAQGSALNSDGVAGNLVWGKRASWISYWAPFNDEEIGISIFDHPSNLRHPTWWHARDYGLVAANPFGVSNFEGKPKGTGDLVLGKGEEITFRYRVLFHLGNPKDAEISQRYLDWSKTKERLNN
jgi:hypothetical protein